MKRPALTLTTWNIHKGFSQFNRRLMVHELRERLRALGPELVFLQEVQGLHLGHGARHADWPERPQHEFLAEDVWHASAYGRNVVYDHGHHGNAILSAYPILDSHNQDVTHYRFERRGLLHCSLDVPGFAQPVHCVCVHLSLFGRSRRLQMEALVRQLERLIPADAPLIVAGDFNDWNNRVADILAHRLHMHEAFTDAQRPARSFPAVLPLFRLDRVYVRGFRVIRREVHQGSPWSRISDHAALSVLLERA